jgi:DNA-binding CsgD family transcriptional regulator
VYDIGRTAGDRIAVGDAEGERGLALAQRRGSPKFFIADRKRTLLACSPDLVDCPLLARSLDVLCALLERTQALDATTFEPLDRESMLRIIPLSGLYPGCFAVFIEPINGRNDAIVSAVKRYDVTKREADVLALLVKGFSTQRIAQHLFISEGTVADHVKSLFRKTRTNKRSELVSRVFRHEHDGTAGLDRATRASE